MINKIKENIFIGTLLNLYHKLEEFNADECEINVTLASGKQVKFNIKIEDDNSEDN